MSVGMGKMPPPANEIEAAQDELTAAHVAADARRIERARDRLRRATRDLWAEAMEGEDPVDESVPITSSDVNLACAAKANELWGGGQVSAPEPQYTITLDKQSYEQILRLTIDNMGDMSGLRQVIMEVLTAHPDWDDPDGQQECIGEGCGWTKGKNHTREKAFRIHQAYVLFHAIKAAGFRKVYEGAE